MFNVSLKLRDTKDFVTPKGPSFTWARTVQSDIDGTQISFKAPKHKPLRSNHEGYAPKRHYSESDLRFRNYYDEEKAARGLPDYWREADFFYHAWGYYGPWFTGAMAELRCFFTIEKIVNYPEGISLFHPRAFEQVIGDNLTYMYSHHLDQTRNYIQEFNGPFDWEPLHHLPVNAVKLQVKPIDFYNSAIISHHVYFPIADNLMASLLFWPSRLKAMTKAKLDKLVDEQPMLELMDDIIKSMQLTLSPKAQAQKDAALAGLEDTSLVEDYPLLKWDKVDEQEKAKILSSQN